MARSCQQAINDDRRQRLGGWRAALSNGRESLQMEARIAAFQSLMLVHRVMRRFKAWVLSFLHPAQFRIVRAVQRSISSRPAA